MSCVPPSVITPRVTVTRLIVMFAAGLKSSSIVGWARGSGARVTIPDLIPPRKVP